MLYYRTTLKIGVPDPYLLGLLDPYPKFFYGSGSGSFRQQAKKVIKTLLSAV
jgi:hypothetical protein